MVRLVSSSAALEADRAAEERFDYPPLLLMEEAGIRLQDRLEALREKHAELQGPTVYLVGPGNNGGDALVMARQAFLRGDPSVSVVSVVPPRSESCRWQGNVVQSLGIPRYSWPDPDARESLSRAKVWVDGILGTGFHPPIRPELHKILGDLETLRAQGSHVCVAVDVPSGLWEGFTSGPVLRAAWTLAPGWLKDFCFYPEGRPLVGVPLPIPLAFPRPAASTSDLLGPGDLGSLLPPLEAHGHKRNRGHVLVVGGAEGMSGAALLAAQAAAGAGAGLVTLGVDPGLVNLVAPQVPAFQVRTADSWLPRTSQFHSGVVGPGWGKSSDRRDLLQALWTSGLPLVIDADGLDLWASMDLAPRSAPVVITPHPGEFRRLETASGPLVLAAQHWAEKKKVTVVLKGAVTWILGPGGERAVWDGNNPALGTGGSGDCLAGIVGALLARGLDGFAAAQAAVALHGQAGRDLADSQGWFTADRIPGAVALRAAACMASLGPL